MLDLGEYCLDEGILVVTETEVANGNNKVSSQVVVDVLPSNTPCSFGEENNKFLSEIGDNCGLSSMIVGTERLQRSTNMKSRSLSPATESLAQNNAFNSDSNGVLKDRYLGQGAKPKVRNFPLTGSSEVNVIASDRSNGTMECNTNSNGTIITQPPVEYNNTNGTVRTSVHRTSLQQELELLMKYEDEDRWADRANCGLKFIDDEKENKSVENNIENSVICDSSQLTPTSSDTQKRLYLAASEELLKDLIKLEEQLETDRRESVDSLCTDEDSSTVYLDSRANLTDSESANNSTQSIQMRKDFLHNNTSLLRDSYNDLDLGVNYSASLPASPLRRSSNNMDSPTRRLRDEVLKGKCKHYSPIFKRKSKYSTPYEEDMVSTTDEVQLNKNFKNLESFQKAQFKQKVNSRHLRSSANLRYNKLINYFF